MNSRIKTVADLDAARRVIDASTAEHVLLVVPALKASVREQFLTNAWGSGYQGRYDVEIHQGTRRIYVVDDLLRARGLVGTMDLVVLTDGALDGKYIAKAWLDGFLTPEGSNAPFRVSFMEPAEAKEAEMAVMRTGGPETMSPEARAGHAQWFEAQLQAAEPTPKEMGVLDELFGCGDGSCWNAVIERPKEEPVYDWEGIFAAVRAGRTKPPELPVRVEHPDDAAAIERYIAASEAKEAEPMAKKSLSVKVSLEGMPELRRVVDGIRAELLAVTAERDRLREELAKREDSLCKCVDCQRRRSFGGGR